jgi:orotate phosphoribosyltransferase
MQINESTAAKIAEYLLQIKAIKLQPNNPFTWASGLKSPIYSDNRLSLSHPAIRTFIKEALAQEIKKNYPQVEAIIGVATAGIAPGALVADALNLPFGYVRSEPKKHGMGKQVEGDIRPDMAVVVIEDLGLASIFTYGLQIAEDNFLAANCKLLSLCNYDALIETAVDKGYVNEADILVLKSWRTNPAAFGK